MRDKSDDGPNQTFISSLYNAQSVGVLFFSRLAYLLTVLATNAPCTAESGAFEQNCGGMTK